MKRILSTLLSASLLLLSLSGCGSKNDSLVVMTIDGEEIRAEEYAYFVSWLKNSYEAQFQGMLSWDDPQNGQGLTDMLFGQAKEQMIRMRAVKKLAADEGISLTDEDEASLQQDKQLLIKSQFNGSQADFQARLKEMGGNEAFYDESNRSYLLEQKLSDKYYNDEGGHEPTDEEIKKYYNEHYMRVKHILQMGLDAETRQPLPDEQKQEKKAKADEILSKIQAGSDFDALMKENTEDPGINTNPDGYTFCAEDPFDPAFIDAAEKLAENEVSPVVEGQSGYHILKRLPLDEATLEKEGASVRAGQYGDINRTIRQDVVYALTAETRSVSDKKLQDKLTEYAEKLQIETKPEFDDINLKNLNLYIAK